MKKIITAIGIATVFLSSGIIKAQVAIGKESLTNGSVLLEFGPEPKGIILPSTASVPGAVGGTFVFNTLSKSLQVMEGTTWTHLTDDSQGIPHAYSNTGPDVGNGVIIGSKTSLKPGILVLESTSKAMVLPKTANPHLSMKGAIAGTMVYDTTADMLAVYDGANWSYWK